MLAAILLPFLLAGLGALIALAWCALDERTAWAVLQWVRRHR